MSMIIRELQEFIGFGLRGQKFIPKQVQEVEENVSEAQKERSPRLTARRPDKCLAACGNGVREMLCRLRIAA